MISSVRVIGTGRAGGAIAARLAERGLPVSAGREATGDADLVLLAVPDGVISEVATRIPIGPWVAHVSGATPLSALEPHTRRFSVHPLQTLSRERGPEQLDGAWAAITSETDDAAAAATWLAEALGLRPFPLADADKPLYHAGAAMASNFLVTLYRAAARLMEQTDAPAEALLPLMQRTIDNGFVLTGPIARGDWSTVEAHLRALEEQAPDLVPLYRALAEATRP
ncbi:MAG TPA: DUF2520 domain-containing protein [Candidatus Limnocylindrales bacterium]|nr:DUF2520 domain-containing protein [Candidatus Limnocylindrales bacterium]